MRPKNRPLHLGSWPVAIRDPNTSCFGGMVGTKVRFERVRGKEVGTASANYLQGAFFSRGTDQWESSWRGCGFQGKFSSNGRDQAC